MLKRNTVWEIARDAEMFACLVKEGRDVTMEMAGKMRTRYSEVAFPSCNVPSAGYYSNLLVMAQIGKFIPSEDAARVEEFQREAEAYMATC